MDNSRIEASKILVWGHIGQELKSLDPKRVLAIAQQDPRYYLSIIANKEIDTMIREVYEKGLSPKIEEEIAESNRLEALFEEVADFLHNSEDMLSTGSFLTGELKGDQALLRIVEDG